MFEAWASLLTARVRLRGLVQKAPRILQQLVLRRRQRSGGTQETSSIVAKPKPTRARIINPLNGYADSHPTERLTQSRLVMGPPLSPSRAG